MEVKNEFVFTNTVTLELVEYQRLMSVLEDQRNKSSSLGKTLENYSRFLQELDNNPKVIDIYMKKLDATSKIGSSFYAAFEEFVELIKNDLTKIEK